MNKIFTINVEKIKILNELHFQRNELHKIKESLYEVKKDRGKERG